MFTIHAIMKCDEVSTSYFSHLTLIHLLCFCLSLELQEAHFVLLLYFCHHHDIRFYSQYNIERTRIPE